MFPSGDHLQRQRGIAIAGPASPNCSSTAARLRLRRIEHNLVLRKHFDREDLGSLPVGVHRRPGALVKINGRLPRQREDADLQLLSERLRQESFESDLPRAAVVKVIIQQTPVKRQPGNVAGIADAKTDVAQAAHRLSGNREAPLRGVGEVGLFGRLRHGSVPPFNVSGHAKLRAGRGFAPAAPLEADLARLDPTCPLAPERIRVARLAVGQEDRSRDSLWINGAKMHSIGASKNIRPRKKHGTLVSA